MIFLIAAVVALAPIALTVAFIAAVVAFMRRREEAFAAAGLEEYLDSDEGTRIVRKGADGRYPDLDAAGEPVDIGSR